MIGLYSSGIGNTKHYVEKEVILRLEEEKDFKIVESLTREAFWNVYFPGADEHLLVHKLRQTEEFIKELDFVVIYNNKIVGNIIYVKAKVKNNDLVVVVAG